MPGRLQAQRAAVLTLRRMNFRSPAKATGRPFIGGKNRRFRGLSILRDFWHEVDTLDALFAG